MRKLVLVLVLAAAAAKASAGEPPDDFLRDKVRGMLMGSLFGDALGGPIEFQPPEAIRKTENPPKSWRTGEVMNAAQRRLAGGRIWLRPYRPLRPSPEPYAHWNHDAAPGTVTDDSRHKMILIGMLRTAAREQAWPVGRDTLARTYLDWQPPQDTPHRAAYAGLAAAWLDETRRAARWLLGVRDLAAAYPTERLWSGLPTCYGQMALTPLAALFPGQPARAYRSAYQLAFFDNGWGKDMNSALVAGLSVALTLDVSALGRQEAWRRVIGAMRDTDPYAYGSVPWTQRSVDRWLERADRLVANADGQPAKLFAALDDEFGDDIKWEAQVPFTVIFAALKIADYEPLAALQLSIEWGHDHDSYAQLLGAFLGALYGENLLAPAWREAVESRLLADYGESVEDWTNTLFEVEVTGRNRPLIREE